MKVKHAPKNRLTSEENVTNDIVELLEDFGSRWQKHGHDRLYLDSGGFLDLTLPDEALLNILEGLYDDVDEMKRREARAEQDKARQVDKARWKAERRTKEIERQKLAEEKAAKRTWQCPDCSWIVLATECDDPSQPQHRDGECLPELTAAFAFASAAPHSVYYAVVKAKHGWSPRKHTKDGWKNVGKREFLDAARKAQNIEAAMKTFGDKYDACLVCNRELTNEASRLVGVGPICLGNYRTMITEEGGFVALVARLSGRDHDGQQGLF